MDPSAVPGGMKSSSGLVGTVKSGRGRDGGRELELDGDGVAPAGWRPEGGSATDDWRERGLRLMLVRALAILGGGAWREVLLSLGGVVGSADGPDSGPDVARV